MHEPERTEPRGLVPVLVLLCTVVSLVSSLGAPLVPTIADVDDVSLSAAQWSLTVTLLVGAVATPTMGRLADGPLRRRVVLGALVVVLLGTVLSALPLGFGALVAGRALQGVGLGLVPLAMAVARDALPPERGRAVIGVLSVSAVAGVGLGYPVTGLVADTLSLHAAFWVGAACTAVALALAVRVLPASTSTRAARLDLPGAVLLGAGVALLVLGLAEGSSWGWASPRLLGAWASAAVLLTLWTRHERRTAAPLVDLSLLRVRAVLTADVTALFAGVGMYLLMSMVTRYVQTPASAGYGFAASVVTTGLVLVPLSVGSVLASRLTPWLGRRLTPELVLPLGSLVFLLALLLFACARGSLWQVLIVMAVAGLGVGCTFSAMPGLLVRAVPAAETGSAMSFNQVLRTIGFAAGSALSASVLQASTPAGEALPTDAGYTTSALLGCGLWALTAVLALVLPRGGTDPGREP
ncbi:MAG: transporter, partial [Frankiales bacterium]|nr:transporter [Frankiales bacterium]